MTVPSRTLRAANTSSCRGVCSRGSWFRRGPSSSAGRAGCDQGPGFGSSHEPRGRPREREGDIEADDATQFVDKLRVGGELELLQPVRLKAVRTPDAFDGARAVSTTLAIMAEVQSVASAGGSVWVSITTRSVMVDPSADRRGPRLVAQQTVVTFLDEALLPTPDTGLRFAGPTHDFIGADSVRAQQDDSARQTCLCGAVRSRASTFRRRRSASLRVMRNSGTHASDSHSASPR